MKKFESIRSKMVGKDVEEIIDKIAGKSPIYKLDRGIDHDIVELVKIAIEEGAETKNHWFLVKAIEKGNIDIVNLLIDNKLGLEGLINVIKVRISTYEIMNYLKDIGFEFNKIHKNFEPNILDSTESIIIFDFIKLHKKFISNIYNVPEYNITDDMWDNSLSKIVRKIEEILNKYGMNFTEFGNPFLYGSGDLKIGLGKFSEIPKDREIHKKLKGGVDNIDLVYKIIIDTLTR